VAKPTAYAQSSRCRGRRDPAPARQADDRYCLSDGHKAYLEAVEGAFGSDIDYAMLVKIYEPSGEGEKRYSPARFSFSEPAGTPQ
jgi:hypothetical protein